MGDYVDYGSITTLTDPFVDSANGDLRLANGSAAIRAATNGADIGALPYLSSSTATANYNNHYELIVT